MQSYLHHIFALLAFFVFAASVALGLQDASLNVQVHYLWNNGIALSDWYVERDVHALGSDGKPLVVTEAHRLRYALSYPVFLVSERSGINPDTLFTMLVPLFASGTVWFIGAIASRSTKTNKPRAVTLAVLPVFGSFFLMDGRLILAFLGFALVLYAALSPYEENLAKVILLAIVGMLFVSVSSGTFISVFLVLTATCLHNAAVAKTIKARLVAATPALFVALLYHYDLWVSASKNVAYYGGGSSAFIRLLEHGYGTAVVFVLETPVLVGLAIAVVLGLSIVGLRLLRALQEPRFFLIATATVLLGAFGYSVLSLAIIPVSLLTGVEANNFLSRSSPQQKGIVG